MPLIRPIACALGLLIALAQPALQTDPGQAGHSQEGAGATSPTTAASSGVGAAPPGETAGGKVEGFPSRWVGHWRGDALNNDGRRPDQRFTMELIIAPTADPSRYEWTIVYADESGTAPRQERRYQLVVRNAATGEWAIDERNGIVIESRMLNGALYSHFAVQGTRITTREKLEGFGTPEERIEVEMVVTREDDAVVSGGADQSPEVRSWRPQSLQHASLRRVPVTTPK